MSDGTRTQTHGQRRRAAILAEGLRLWPACSARRIGKALGMSHATVLYHYHTSEKLRDAIAAEAVRTLHAPVVRLLIATSHPATAALSPAERRRIALHIP
jgi:AcrR family transcriptional regulator